MNRGRAAVWIALMLASSARGDETFFVHRLDSDLRTVGTATWREAGSVSGPVHVSKEGEVVALVTDAAGRLQLMRWTGDGHEQARRTIDLAPPVRGSRLVGADALVAVTETAVAKVSLRDGRVLEKADVGFAIGKGAVAPSPHGAWFALDDRLVFVGLGGRRIEKSLPLGVPPLPENRVAYLLATEQDGCVLTELSTVSHEVSGRNTPDRTSQAVLTLLTPGGEVLARVTRGRTTTEREWFWAEGSTEGPIPRGFGIVRRRWSGSVYVESMGEIAGGGFALLSLEDVGPGEGRHELAALDPALRERWHARYGGRPWGPSPSGNGILFRSELDRMSWFDPTSGREQNVSLSFPRDVNVLDLLRTALGTDAAGRWIVVSYGAPRRVQ